MSISSERNDEFDDGLPPLTAEDAARRNVVRIVGPVEKGFTRVVTMGGFEMESTQYEGGGSFTIAFIDIMPEEVARILRLARSIGISWEELSDKNKAAVSAYLSFVGERITARTGESWEPVGDPLAQLEQAEEALKSAKHVGAELFKLTAIGDPDNSGPNRSGDMFQAVVVADTKPATKMNAKLREDRFYAKIRPITPIPNDELDRSVPTNLPVDPTKDNEYQAWRRKHGLPDTEDTLKCYNRVQVTLASLSASAAKALEDYINDDAESFFAHTPIGTDDTTTDAPTNNTLTETNVYVKREHHHLEFFAHETIGSSIGNFTSVATTDDPELMLAIARAEDDGMISIDKDGIITINDEADTPHVVGE